MSPFHSESRIYFLFSKDYIMLVQSKYNDFGLKNFVIKVYDVLRTLFKKIR
ncbi:hypothetical protein LEP1GSC188_0465 [Leptospira weilii serovar Topaz str. LT2116]|uniref:Uncharacterized protein n=1 Tax=Leptospira weilii serovar Topaz str. LT2116 TaxID=1088540 RepID=M3H4W7_9LEPT|nr:hypothetical protein LEP1GSC188_0465 [Leptospira weilii serovar Topaz str. LT2116]